YNLALNDVTGTSSITNSLLQTSYGFVTNVANATGTLNLSVTNSSFGGATNGVGFGIYPAGSSNVTVNFQNDSLANHSARGIQAATTTTTASTMNITVNQSKFRNNFVSMDIDHGSSGTSTFNVTNNDLQATTGSSQAININRLADPSFTNFGLFSGTISTNTIGTQGVLNSGSDAGDGITVKTNGNGGTTRVTITSNTIREIGQEGISVAARDATTGHTLHARIQSNSIGTSDAVALSGVFATLGASNTDHVVMCLDIASNTTVGAMPQNGVRIRSSGSPPAVTTLTLPSYDGTGATYFASRNPGATGTLANASFANGGTGATTTAGTCTTP
ncbi:MAG: putative Outer rane adhesin like protein, partial [Gemmatimonadetes bacterium]|nr:putative Outer rane adhesin like protein [Gemmatimonadota bacterium]